MAIKLVIVDDAPFIREVLRHIFVGPEFQVIGEARDGQEAVEICQRLRPQVVLMDIVMPRMSGIEATMEILKELPETRVVACSTVDQNSMVLRALDAGCCNYVIKPFKAEDVLSAVRAAARLGSKEAGV
ncbi:MAG: response regulator [Bdellovibrionales bacterium]|nr:response regulator [Bdellovibrionales bacterium]